MKTFISASDIETLAAQGVRELTVDEDTVLTSVARETAARVGVKLVAPGASAPARPAATPAVSGSSDLVKANPAKPKGCQHGPLSAGSSSAPAAAARPASSGGPVVDELIGAVKQMARTQSAR
jgi:hypothetical protein